MRFQQLRQQVNDIARIARTGDHEAAHSRCDTLLEDVLRAIAEGTCEDGGADEFATEALRAATLPFKRWCG